MLCSYFFCIIPLPRCRCADYVKHLIELNKEKETAVEKAKSDLAQREHERLEKQKAAAEADADAVEGNSEPESETSSLTAFSSGEGAPPTSMSNDEEKDKPEDIGRRRSKRVRESLSTSEDGRGNSGAKKSKFGQKRKQYSPSAKQSSCTTDPSSSRKKVRLSDGRSKSINCDDNTLSSDEPWPGGRNISLDKMSSSVSEMTDSNQSSMVASRSRRKVGGAEDDASGERSSSSISSTAAVGPPRGGIKEKGHHHADLVDQGEAISSAHWPQKEVFRGQREDVAQPRLSSRLRGGIPNFQCTAAHCVAGR